MGRMLGKIQKVHIGLGGYQGAMIGIGFTLTGEGWGAQTEWYGFWAREPDKDTQWTEKDKIEKLGKTFKKLGDLLKQAKKTNAYDLEGVPVEAVFVNDRLQEWRILNEVL